MSAELRLGLGVAMRLIYDSRANATDKAVLACIVHAGDWSDAESGRPAAAAWLAERTGMARSTVLASLARLRAAAVVEVRRTGHANLVRVGWQALESYVSRDGHVGGPRKKRASTAPAASKQPVDNSVDIAGKPVQRPATGHREMTGHRSPDDRPPVTRRPATGHQTTGHRSHTSSLDSLPPNSREGEGYGERAGDNSDGLIPQRIPAWLAKQARESDVLPVELYALIEVVAERLHRTGPGRAHAVAADGPTILRMWDALGRPDPSTLAVELALVADAFHDAPMPMFARYVRNEGRPGASNAFSATVLCQVERWTERLTAARAWDLAGRPDRLSGGTR